MLSVPTRLRAQLCFQDCAPPCPPSGKRRSRHYGLGRPSLAIAGELTMTHLLRP
jgi:hypothetical protein